MKGKLLGVLVAVLLLTIVFSGCQEDTKEPIENNKTHIEIATDFMNKLQQKKYDISYKYFNNEMKNSLPLSQLKSTWEYFILTYGDFNDINETIQTLIEGYEVVYVNCTFNNNYLLIFRIVFDADKKIAGFWQDNAILLSTYNAPNYVNTQNFSEMNLTIGASHWELPATLSIPHGTESFPCVILVHGSGPNDRDETIGPNKPFKDIAWGLASKGIAVLRYDKRTKIYPEEIATNINFTLKEELVDDVLSAIDFLYVQSYIPIKNIIVIGHSLGGMMIPRIVSLDDMIDGCILMAAPARSLEDLILSQILYLSIGC